MADHLPVSRSIKNIGASKGLKSYLIAPPSFATPKNPIDRVKRLPIRGPSAQVALFLVEVAVLDVARRLSRRKCPILWHAIQSLHLLNLPPFKWIQRWEPLKGVVKGLQALSKPLLFLSVVRIFSDNCQRSDKSLHVITNPPFLEPSAGGTNSDSCLTGEPSESSSCDWLLQLREDLRSQGVFLPERFTDDELKMFFFASNGDSTCLQHSLMRSIRWRETYKILPPEELSIWSNMMFWHGRDVKLRPCLIIRLGLACSNSLFQCRPSFLDALVSQIEYGVLNLLDKEDPTVTVLVDCKGVTPLKFPMKMLRSCATLMKEHYPNRLATLLVIRLPPVARVLAQTFLQVLGPSTRQKLHVPGDAYQKHLSEFLQSVPSFLGGECTCCRCCDSFPPKINNNLGDQHIQNVLMKDVSDDCMQGLPPSPPPIPCDSNLDKVLGNTIISFLMLWIVFVVLMGFHDSGHLSILRL